MNTIFHEAYSCYIANVPKRIIKNSIRNTGNEETTKLNPELSTKNQIMSKVMERGLK